ncbi:MAG: CRTAC1 family protein [Acidobacteria bacterium]|nr:CRTAC1 family protein [Acidobacteriota bacterium]
MLILSIVSKRPEESRSARTRTAFAALICLPAVLLCCAGSALGQVAKPNKSTEAPSPNVPGHFVDITQQSGVDFTHRSAHTPLKYLIETMGSGVALFDCDNDGRLDIFFVNGAPIINPEPKGTIPKKTGPEYWNRLFHQKPDGTFEDITEKSGLQGIGFGMGVAVGDYDNDGHEDLFVTSYGGNQLYHNNGNCTFTDVTAAAHVGGEGWSTSAAWVDLDNDGRLDLVVARYMKWDWNDEWCGEHLPGHRAYCHPDIFPAVPMLAYHNDGGGRFTEVAQRLGLDKPARALGLAIADYDHDGRIDLFVANDSMPEFLFHQKNDGSFEEVAMESTAAVNGDGQTYAGMGVDFEDYDNDGWSDVFITDLANQRYALYRNLHDTTFDYVTNPSGIGKSSLLHSGWSTRFLDYDNDGWKDLLVAQGHDLDNVELENPLLHYREPMMLLRNMKGRFDDVSSTSGEVFKKSWAARGMAIGDLDNDGLIDAVVTLNDGEAHVLRNETAGPNHWVTLRLIGHQSNRDGIGAVVEVTGSGPSQWATVTTSSGYLSSSDPRVHFGLGVSPGNLSLEIHWPSGIVQKLQDLKPDRQITVDEPANSDPSSGAKP